jgi:hypothetical protein
MGQGLVVPELDAGDTYQLTIASLFNLQSFSMLSPRPCRSNSVPMEWRLAATPLRGYWP